MENIGNPKFFDDCVKKFIEQQINVGRLYYVDLVQIPLYKIIEYSNKYPNKIKELSAFENKDYNNIKKLCDLNSESLIHTPNCKLELYSNLKKIEIYTINSEHLTNPLPDNFNYSSIKDLETIFIKDVVLKKNLLRYRINE